MNADGIGIAPFAIENGVVKMVNARIAGANIDELFVKGTQIESGAVSLAKNESLAAGGGGTVRDFVINHGLNTDGAHHELRIEIQGGGSAGGSTSTSAVVTVIDLQAGVTLATLQGAVRGPAHPAGQQNANWNTYRYYSVPKDRTSTTLRFTYANTGASYSAQLVGCFVFKNTPDGT